jgi:hypothetical protein
MKNFSVTFVACILVIVGSVSRAHSQDTPKPAQAATSRNGSHDFDFEIGTRRTHLWRLLNSLTAPMRFSTNGRYSTWQIAFCEPGTMTLVEQALPRQVFQLVIDPGAYLSENGRWTCSAASTGSCGDPIPIG